MYGSDVMLGRCAGRSQVLAGTMPRGQTGQQKVQLYYEDDLLSKSRYIIYVHAWKWTHMILGPPLLITPFMSRGGLFWVRVLSQQS